jgi:methyl-accepting chemotaxis protein/truncated hemoglobin YjbI
MTSPRIPTARTHHDPEEKAMSTTTTSTLYDGAGGPDGLALAVELLYERVLIDPALAAAFSTCDLDQLESRHVRQLTVLLGGPQPRPGRDTSRALADVHAALELAPAQRAAVSAHLLAVLHDLGIDDATTAGIASVLSTLTDEGTAVLTSDDLSDGSLFGTEESARFESMLENAPTNVMFADRDNIIRYMNPASLRTLRTLEQHLPVRADQVVGSSLDIFHSKPEYQQGILVSEENLPRRTNIKVGPETLDLLVSAITDKTGSYLGAMATWEVVTERLRVEAATAEAASDTRALNEVLTAVGSATSTEAATQAALNAVRGAFGWAYGSYWAIDKSSHTLRFVVESGDAGEEFRAITLAASFAEGVGLSGRAWKTRDLFFTRDIGEMTDCVRAPVAQRVGVKSGVCFPLIVNGEVLGTMDFFATETLDPSAERLDALRNVAKMVSSALERIAKLEADAQAAADIAAVNKVLAAVGDATSVHAATQIALDTVRDAFGWAYGSYWAIEQGAQELTFVVESGDAGAEFRAVTLAASFKEGVGLSGRAWKTRDLFFTRDIGEMTDCVRAPVAQRVGVKSGVCFPIIVNGEVLGTMDFFATETLDPSTDRLDALRNVGRIVSSALDRIAKSERESEAAADTSAVNKVLAAVAEATSVVEATQVALDTVRSAFGWAYGSYWSVDHSDRALKFVVESGDAGAEFRKVTLAASFTEGVGLSGRAWKTRDLFFTRDIGEMTDCVRAPVAQRVGVKSGVCFPIIVNGEVLGTMDFFATETLSPSTDRLDALRNVGRIVSGALDRIAKAESDKARAQDLQDKVDAILEVVTAAAAGDLTRAVTVTGEDAVGQMGQALNTFFTELRGSITAIGLNAQSLASASDQLNGVSQQMGGAAEETATQAGVVAAAAEQVNVNVQTVAGGSEEMSASISEIAKNAADAARVAGQAVDVAGTATSTVAKLGESSAEIGKVIKVITSIAQQTNLLALNATIEAARAGEAGKGFAVVANEVKELAKETAKATEDISQKIEAIQGDTRGAVEAIEQISSIIGQINDIQSSIASAVEEQTATTNEIARNVAEAAKGSGDIAENISGVAQAAQGTAKGAEETQRSAGELSQMASELQQLVDRFTV